MSDRNQELIAAETVYKTEIRALKRRFTTLCITIGVLLAAIIGGVLLRLKLRSVTRLIGT